MTYLELYEASLFLRYNNDTTMEVRYVMFVFLAIIIETLSFYLTYSSIPFTRFYSYVLFRIPNEVAMGFKPYWLLHANQLIQYTA